jgi:hypothetical protein
VKPSSPAALLGAIARILTYAGATTRPHRLEIVSRIVGRDLETTKDLSLGEQRSVLRYLRTCEDVGELRLLVEQHAPEPLRATADEEARCV